MHINVSSLGTWKQEAKNVYNLRLQLHGDNRDTWINYFNNKYKDEFGPSELSDGTLFLLDSNDAGGVSLTFLNSIVVFNMIGL